MVRIKILFSENKSSKIFVIIMIIIGLILSVVSPLYDNFGLAFIGFGLFVFGFLFAIIVWEYGDKNERRKVRKR